MRPALIQQVAQHMRRVTEDERLAVIEEAVRRVVALIAARGWEHAVAIHSHIFTAARIYVAHDPPAMVAVSLSSAPGHNRFVNRGKKRALSSQVGPAHALRILRAKVATSRML